MTSYIQINTLVQNRINSLFMVTISLKAKREAIHANTMYDKTYPRLSRDKLLCSWCISHATLLILEIELNSSAFYLFSIMYILQNPLLPKLARNANEHITFTMVIMIWHLQLWYWSSIFLYAILTL